MTTQTSYSQRHSAAFAGQIADMSGPRNIISRRVEESAGIGFGKVVVKGTADDQIIAPNANGENNYVGFTIRNNAARKKADGSEDLYNQYEHAEVMTQGVLWVTCGGNVAAGANVYFTEATGALDDASGSNITQVPNAKWLDTQTSGGLARIELR